MLIDSKENATHGLVINGHEKCHIMLWNVMTPYSGRRMNWGILFDWQNQSLHHWENQWGQTNSIFIIICVYAYRYPGVQYVACSIFARSDLAWNLWITSGWSQMSAFQFHLSSLLKNKNGSGGDKEQNLSKEMIKISILTNGQ